MKVHPHADPQPLPGSEFRLLVEDELLRFLVERRAEAASPAPDVAVLFDELIAMLRAGGKRLRPLFCHLGYRAGGGEDGPEIVRAAAAVELLHMAAVIHDDVMDRATLRRGEPPAFRRLADASGSEEFGRSAAILAGDLAQALADDLLASSGFPADRVLRAAAHFNRMRVRAVSGEFMDLISTRDRTTDESRARRVAALKSGSYTVVGPLLVGAALADARAQALDALERYGTPLGEAFQLQDDVLGSFGDPLLTGKDRDTDIREGKRTTLVAKAIEMSDPASARLLRDRVGAPDLTAPEVEDIRGAIRNSGALAETIALVDSLARQAKEALSGLVAPADVAEELAVLADLVALRVA